jgi:hypothetical protein
MKFSMGILTLASAAVSVSGLITLVATEVDLD